MGGCLIGSGAFRRAGLVGSVRRYQARLIELGTNRNNRVGPTRAGHESVAHDRGGTHEPEQPGRAGPGKPQQAGRVRSGRPWQTGGVGSDGRDTKVRRVIGRARVAPSRRYGSNVQTELAGRVGRCSNSMELNSF